MTGLQYIQQGTPYFEPLQVMAADGAIAIASGVVVITKATAAVITLPAPVRDGAKLTVVTTTAAAHTVTNSSPGFNSGGASSDVATFTAAIGNGFEAVAYNGAWRMTRLTGVALG